MNRYLCLLAVPFGELPIFLLAAAYTSGGGTVGTAFLIPCRWLAPFRLGFTDTSGGAPLPIVADTLQVAGPVPQFASLIPPVVAPLLIVADTLQVAGSVPQLAPLIPPVVAPLPMVADTLQVAVARFVEDFTYTSGGSTAPDGR